MSRLIHLRGDISGMLVFFMLFFLGAWQVVIAVKRLNGLSLTGRPDRASWSVVLGVAITIGACAWYFSREGHFASPDLEGVETLIVLVLGLAAATVVQGVLAQCATVLRRGRIKVAGERLPGGEPVTVIVDGSEVTCRWFEASGGSAGTPVLLLHDYAGASIEVGALASFLASEGHPCLACDLDGHGGNPRGIDDPDMKQLLGAASADLRRRSGSESFAVAGAGLGGLLALGMAGDEGVAKAIAIDPPARDAEGFPDVNALRELSCAEALGAALRPAARAGSGRRVSLSKLISSMSSPPSGEACQAGMVIIGTRYTWYNDPDALRRFAELCSPFEPVFIPGEHSTLAREEGTTHVVSGAL